MTITIYFRDGTKKVFPPVGLAGGSSAKRIRYEGGMAIVTNEWEREEAFPLDTIKSVETVPNYR